MPAGLIGLELETGWLPVLLQGARAAADLLYADEFDAFADAHPWFRYVPCLSREARTSGRADDRSGYVQNAFPAFAPDAARDIAYLGGNPNMVDASFEALIDSITYKLLRSGAAGAGAA